MANSFTKRLPGGSKFVGEVFSMMGRVAVSPSFPAFNLANAAVNLADANWPLLAAHLRDNVILEYDPFGTPVSSFPILSWTTGGLITLTNTAAAIAIANALHEEAFVHTSNTSVDAVYSANLTGLTNFRTVTLPSPLTGSGNPIPAGTYEITAVQGSTRQFTINIGGVSPAPSGTPTGSVGTVEFYPHRLINGTGGLLSTSNVRHFPVAGRGFMTPDGTSGLLIAGLRRRSFLQGHFTELGLSADVSDGNTSMNASANAISTRSQASAAMLHITRSQVSTVIARNPISDTVNGTPRTGADTMGPSLALHSYIYGGVYNP